MPLHNHNLHLFPSHKLERPTLLLKRPTLLLERPTLLLERPTLLPGYYLRGLSP